MEALARFQFLRITKTYFDTLLKLKVITINFINFCFGELFDEQSLMQRKGGAWSPTVIPEQ